THQPPNCVERSRDHALPSFAGCNDPGHDGTGKDCGKYAAAFLRRLRAARRGAWLLDSRTSGRIARRAAVHLETNGAVPQTPEYSDGPAFALVRAASG